jgi:lipopolysaccharide transport system permease protein
MADDTVADRAELPLKPLLVIYPPSGWQFLNLRELWQFRDLLYFLIWRDVKVRYKQTVLGAAWAILQPAMMMAVFTIFFSRMAGVPAGDVPYPLFAFAGLLPWTFFATAVASAGNSVVGSERLITKIYFPRLAVPFAAVGAAVVDFLIASGLLLVLMAYYHESVSAGPGVLLAPIVFLLIVVLALGIGTFLAALNVAYRDFRYIVPFLIQIGMFATPTIYMQPRAESTNRLLALLSLNPMTTLIGAFRAAVLGGPIPWGGLALASVAALLIFVAACLYYRRVEDSFADVI